MTKLDKSKSQQDQMDRASKVQAPLEDDAQAQFNSANNLVLVSPRIMIGLIGAATCFSWLFFILGTSVYMPHTSEFLGMTFFVHLSFLCGFLLSLFLIWLLSALLMKSRIAHVCLSVGFIFFGAIGITLGGTSLVWYVVFAFSAGLGYGLLYVLYGEYVVLFFKSDIKAHVLGVFLVATILCGGLLIVDPGLYSILFLAVPALSFVAYLVQLVMFRLDKQASVTVQVSDRRTNVPWRAYIATGTADLATGFALGCILSNQSVGYWTYIVVFVGLLLTFVVLFTDSIKKNNIGESVTMRWFLPASAALVFPMLFVPGEVQVVLAVLLLCGSLFPVTSSLAAMCKHVLYCGLLPIRAFALGRVFGVAGLLIGTLLGLVGFSALSLDYFGSVATVSAVVGLMFLVILSAAFVMTENNYPHRSRFKEVIRTTVDGEESSIVMTPGMSIHAAGDLHAKPSDDDTDLQARAGLFQRKCEIVADRFDLSERQGEVLFMLAKGRNADYINKKLVISSHTAKAHIYNIYQKTGVHSRQELMDIVEEVRIEQ